MRHTGMGAALGAALVMGGCFGAHGRGDDADAGPLGDGGLVGDCAAASAAPEGAPCVDGLHCDDFGSCGPSTTIRCVDGRLRRMSRICSPPPRARDCDEYARFAGGPVLCDAAEFVGCTRDEGDCCFTRIDCEGGMVVETRLCGDCEGECPGYTPPPPEHPICTSSVACEGFPCVPPGTPRACGICRPAEHQCEVDGDCGPGSFCVERAASCLCDGATQRVCEIDCRTAESDPCAAGERCGSDGRCRVLSCEGEWTCGVNQRCTPGADAPTDAHGCSRVACDTALDCDCGACIDGLCYDGPGTCEPPVP
ncbi:hypothetical protein [Sandaracinus amylolyticus]|nr:hypothetical protein [Sandaracinus amylolyticus]